MPNKEKVKAIKPIPLFDTLAEHKLFNEQAKNFPYPKDYQYSSEFLYSYRGSEATFNSYRRELERFLQWCRLIAKKSLPEIKRSDIECFVEFCQSPPFEWIGGKNVARFINKNGERIANSDWRPFVIQNNDPKQYQLSQKALQAIFSILGSFFSYLLQEEYIESNPVAQIRQKSKFLRKQQSHTMIRRLTELQWAYVIETAEIMAKENPEEHERTLFIMNALYGMYLRISELAASQRWEPQMGHFHRDTDNHWWFKTVGKGNKERIITVSDSMLEALKRYRQNLNFPALPFPGETTPLIQKSKGKGPITSTRMIRFIVQKCFEQSSVRLIKDGFEQEADLLKAATVHWLRHTGISDDVKHRPREHVRDDAGHGSSAITDKYIDVNCVRGMLPGRKKSFDRMICDLDHHKAQLNKHVSKNIDF